MLNINQVKHLAARLGFSQTDLMEIADNIPNYVEELLLIDPREPSRPREVINVIGNLRLVQHRIYRRLLLTKLKPVEHSHGGVPGRHIKTNVSPHLGATFAFTTDISSFYPSIHHTRVYRMFAQCLGCSPDVARLLTRLCTYDHHLALGLPTSPILADHIIMIADQRISSACKREGLIYTRFVDDITISGRHSLDPESCGIPALVVGILNNHGFKVQQRKHKYGRLQDGFTITSLRIRRGKIDVDQHYVEELNEQLLDAQRIADGHSPLGLYYTYPQLRGRVEFAAWVNWHRRRSLMRKLRAIDWELVRKNAVKLGLESAKKRVVPRPVQTTLPAALC